MNSNQMFEDYARHQCGATERTRRKSYDHNADDENCTGNQSHCTQIRQIGQIPHVHLQLVVVSNVFVILIVYVASLEGTEADRWKKESSS